MVDEFDVLFPASRAPGAGPHLPHESDIGREPLAPRASSIVHVSERRIASTCNLIVAAAEDAGMVIVDRSETNALRSLANYPFAGSLLAAGLAASRTASAARRFFPWACPTGAFGVRPRRPSLVATRPASVGGYRAEQT